MSGSTWRDIPADDIHVTEEGDLCISTQVEMTDWLVREQRKTIVIYQSRPYYVAAVSRRTGIFEYVLKPWKASAEISGKTITYDGEYVRERNRLEQRTRRLRRTRAFLPLLYLVHGFLWRNSRRWIEEQFGLDSYAATRISIGLEVAAIAVASVVLFVLIWVAAYFAVFGAALFLFKPAYLILVIVVLVPDVIMRINYLMEDENRQYGFYEWLLNRHSE